MGNSTHAILCGACKRQVKTVPDPQPHDKVVCEGCGRTDDFENVMASVKEHVTHLTKQIVAKQLTASTRGNRFVKFKPQHVPNRSFRWEIEGGL